ncbi:hypothetical protein [Streptomyces canus]|uniref:hypothetical protein n=1 Tax=Streptomyces canus TaxID=58343 RepID=UPI00382FB03C
MLPVGSLESPLRAIGELAVRGLLALDPYGGGGHARRNAEQAAAEVARERREREEVSAWLAERDPTGAPRS